MKQNSMLTLGLWACAIAFAVAAMAAQPVSASSSASSLDSRATTVSIVVDDLSTHANLWSASTVAMGGTPVVLASTRSVPYVKSYSAKCSPGTSPCSAVVIGTATTGISATFQLLEHQKVKFDVVYSNQGQTYQFHQTASADRFPYHFMLGKHLSTTVSLYPYNAID